MCNIMYINGYCTVQKHSLQNDCFGTVSIPTFHKKNIGCSVDMRVHMPHGVESLFSIM